MSIPEDYDTSCACSIRADLLKMRCIMNGVTMDWFGVDLFIFAILLAWGFAYERSQQKIDNARKAKKAPAATVAA